MTATSQDSFGVRRSLQSKGGEHDYFSLSALAEALGVDLSRLPFSLKVLLENLLRNEDGRTVTADQVRAIVGWLENQSSDAEIAFRPTRVLMQDFTGVPAVADLAAMRDAMVEMGGDPDRINPLSPVDLVIDHSVQIDSFGSADSFERNVEREFERNGERYEFLRWGQGAFDNFRVVPPGTGICHQVNLEYLASCVSVSDDGSGRSVACPDTVVGTDSHTTMVNGLGVLGWGVGGIEAEAAMLGQAMSMVIPEVVGFRLVGRPPEGTTATDVVLTVVQMLRKKGVVQKFVEFYGPGLDNLTIADRATIANMAPEYGATCGIFPIDQATIDYLVFTGRDAKQVALVEAYAREQGMWRAADPMFTDTLELDLATIEPSLAGPRRPHERVALPDMAAVSRAAMEEMGAGQSTVAEGADYAINPGDVVIAAITSCTNTSNPSILIAAGIVAKKAHERGLKPKPWVKTSLAPGSQVVQDYLEASGLQDPLDALGFNIVGFGCTTCIGNSGPLAEPVTAAITGGDIAVGAVLSGNRNFEGRVHPLTKLNYLASPPLVIAYALAGSLTVNLREDPLGEDTEGEPVYLRDIWPTNEEIHDTLQAALSPDMYRNRYANVAEGPAQWKQILTGGGQTYNWNIGSTYVQQPPFFEDMAAEPEPVTDIKGARALVMLGDSVTTDHISPAGSIMRDSPAGEFLLGHQVRPDEFNSYGARRGNHEVMMRGTFGNIRIRNEMVPDIEGGIARYEPGGETMPIYEAAMKYREAGVPLVVIGGREYGTGSSRDWAAKGTRLLGVRAVIVETFERIHRSNLIGMGVLPLQFTGGQNRESLKLDGTEIFDFTGLEDGISPGMDVACRITRSDGTTEDIVLTCRIETADEATYFIHGGILQYVLRDMMETAQAA